MAFNLIFLLAFGISWGVTVPLIKLAVNGGHHPFGILFWQMLIAVVILGVVLLTQKHKLRVNRSALGYYLLIAVIGTLIPNSFSLMAVAHLPAGIMAIVIATVPLLSLAIALMARLEAFSWKRSVGIVLGVLALVLIAVPDSSLPDKTMVPWLLVALIAPLCYAIEGNFVAAKGPTDISPLATLFGGSVCGVLLLAPLVVLTDAGVSLVGVWELSHWAILGSSLGHVIAYCGYLWLLKRAGAVFTSQIAYVVTLTGIVSAVLFLGERYGWLVWVAVLLMFMGVTLVKPQQAKP